MRHPYQRFRPRLDELPEVGISEEGNIRSLHLGSPTIQSSMNIDDPSALVLSYSQAMMAWLLFSDLPVHITQVGLGGGSFARWIDAFLPDCNQVAIEINPQVINIAKSMFEIPYESEQFEIIEADAAQYIKIMRQSTDIILVDGFDGEQIIDSFVDVPFFEDCHQALTETGIFVTNWWQADKRYEQFVAKLARVFDGRILTLPAQSHGNVVVLAFKQAPLNLHFATLKKRAQKLSDQYQLPLTTMLQSLKSHNPHTESRFVWQ